MGAHAWDGQRPSAIPSREDARRGRRHAPAVQPAARLARRGAQGQLDRGSDRGVCAVPQDEPAATDRSALPASAGTFYDCFLVLTYPDITRLRQLRPMHLEEYKRRRVEGLITEEPSAADVEKERTLRAEVRRQEKVGTARERRAKFGWLGRHGIARKVSPRTINYELRVLFTFFLWAIKRNHLFINPIAPVERFRLPKRVLPKFMTAEELKKFFAACDDYERRLFMTILLTGMRKGEVEYLIWTDISFELGVIFIQEKPDLDWKPKTDERLVPISPIVHNLLVLQGANRTSDQFVFANRAGNRETHMLDRLKKVCRQAGIRVSTVHALRHSFGAHLRMAGRQSRRYRRSARPQGPRHDADLHESTARTFADGRISTESTRAGSRSRPSSESTSVALLPDDKST
jgi:integrase